VATDSSTKPKAKTPRLEAVLSDRCILHGRHVAICAAIGLWFVFASYIPISHAETWLHALTGSQVISTGQLPQQSLLPLAEGREFVASSWLGQVVIAGVQRVAGKEGLSILLAVSLLAAMLMMTRVSYRLTSQLWLSLAAVAILALLWWPQMSVLRPQVLATLCGAGLLWLLIGQVVGQDTSVTTAFGGKQSPTLQQWIGLPLLMVLWTNLDTSFLIGLSVVGCIALGRLLDGVIDQRGLLAAIKQPATRNWIWLAELCLLVTLMNPYGWKLWAFAAETTANPLWQALGGWNSLSLASFVGASFGLCLLLALAIARFSHFRMRAADLLPLLALAILSACNARLLWWFAPVFVVVVMPHLADIVSRQNWPKIRFPQLANKENGEDETLAKEKSLRFAGTLICILIVWACFALTPISNPVMGGKGRTPAQLHDSNTPLGVAKYFAANTPGNESNDLVLAPSEWGDFLQHETPSLQLFASSEGHLLPRQARADYLRITSGDSSWTALLDRYAVGHLVVKKESQTRLLRGVAKNTAWKKVYEDEQAVVFARKPKRVPYKANVKAEQSEKSKTAGSSSGWSLEGGV